MNILIVYDGDYPWDVRIEKISNSLVARGNTVSLLCRNMKRRVIYEKSNGIQIHRLPVFRGKLNHILTFPVFFNPIWIYKIYNIVRCGTELIVIRDLPLALAAIFLGKLLRVPVVYDMAEPYPEGLRSNWLYDKMKLTDYLVRNPVLAEKIECLALRFADALWVVSEESAQRAVQLGCQKNKVSVIGNTPVIRENRGIVKIFPGQMNRLKGRFILIFVGYLLGDRGLDFAVAAFGSIVRANSRIAMFIIGTGPHETLLKDQVNKLKLENDIVFEGWVDNKKIPDYLHSADVGILPFRNCAHINITLANKLFDFMGIGLAVLGSSVRSMKRIINETNAGRLFKPEDAEDFTRVVLEMAVNPDQNKLFGENGRKAAENRYSWKHDESRIFSSIESISNHRKK